MTKKKLIRRKGGVPKDTRHSWSLIDWMLAKLPILPGADLDQVVDEVVKNWQQQAPRGETRKPTAQDHEALVDILAGACIRAEGQTFTRLGVEHYQGSRVLQGWFTQNMVMREGT
jgi:hypothetical protein